MYLKSLTLKGFKSFAQPTTFAFEPGVTCVVGPNGSGKSNVVDALAWVMGEQGAKTLRGGKMEDVIFAGTSTRGPLGRAEVTLTIDNTDGALPIEYTEVTISRTLFRNGGSEYAINGEGCRLLDVQELLSDSGLGREMHVIVGQGQLDQVLRATPEERRGFIEEAAGILKHRRRKEKTVRKLEAMQANLTRLSDLAGEIRRQLKPLGHQAEIAREAASIQAIVRDARARLLADEVVGLREQITSSSRSENERKTERLVLQEQLDQTRLRQHRLEQAQLGDAVDGARRTSHGLEQVQERLRGLYSLANQRLALLSQQAEGPSAVSTVTEQSVHDAWAEAVALEAEIAAAEAAAGRAAAQTATSRAALDSLDEEIAAQSALVSRHDLELAGHTSRVDVAQSKLAAARGELLRQENALEQARERRDAAAAAFAEVDAATVIAEGDASLDEAYRVAEEALAAARARVESLREELHVAERERDALAARTSALSLALDRRSGTGALTGTDGIRGLVADHVKPRPGFEAAVAAVLGTAAEALLADTRETAIAAVSRAREESLGRVEIVIADAAPRSAGSADAGVAEVAGVDGVDGVAGVAGVARVDGVSAAATVPSGITGASGSSGPARSGVAGATALAEVVDAPDGVLALLASAVVVDDLDAARALAPALAAASALPLTIVTRAGDVLTEAVLRGGAGDAPSRIELAAERDDAASRLEAVTTTIERMRGELSDARDAQKAAATASEAALAALREHDSAVAAQSEQLGRLRSQADTTAAEVDRLEAALVATSESVSAALAAVDHAVAERDRFAATPRPMLDASARDGLVEELERARAAELEARIALETARERVRAERARAAALAEQLEAERAAAEEQARHTVIRTRQIAAANRVLAALPPVLDSVDRSVSQARVALAAAEADRAQQNEELAALRRGEADLRERLAAVSESVHGLEMQVYEKKLHLSSLLERAAEELGLVEDVLVAEYGPHLPVPDDAALVPPAPALAPASAPSAAAPSADGSAAPPYPTGLPSAPSATAAQSAPAAPSAPGITEMQEPGLSGDDESASPRAIADDVRATAPAFPLSATGSDAVAAPGTNPAPAQNPAPAGLPPAPPAQCAPAAPSAPGITEMQERGLSGDDESASPRAIADGVRATAPAFPLSATGSDVVAAPGTNPAPAHDPAPAGIPFVRAEQQQRLARAERKLGQLGRVNPLALEEFAALEQRHRFLTEQLADLTKTRADLLTIIDDLDGRMQDIFRSAFEDTRDAFDRVFPILFPGGSGRIELTDPENMLTTGIEVSVRPAGKKIERLSLLSGGERSLAAVALLVAIFQARPSPFYIMDEVEAALDDANLGRLLTIFEQLRESSQLIVITHQKRTMEIADALYGVSMRQDGVSAVVGQRVAAPA
ncbi:AAA family ATPase [Galbitalea sp. SE-J8]|uniref:AAA family ATPase n=1 Tax=Galbitalea sp. SE-J8 TaxID=3054952 RepID=UPI00259CA760|nr:AAA family ATPase [Galbitalea sp. SE-J8]MDM4762922.1 AAA family ATPase [Galbitalea sp. SE-J8]